MGEINLGKIAGMMIYPTKTVISTAPSGARIGDYILNASYEPLTIGGRVLAAGDIAPIDALSVLTLGAVEGNLRGVEGAAYEWLTGGAAPVVGDGKQGDMYLNTSTGDVYKKTSASAWAFQCNLKVVADIVNNLTSTSATSPLSALQGKVLNDSKFPYAGGTITGDVRLQYGGANYGSKLNFGDGDYVYLYEYEDDKLRIKANRIEFYTGSTLAAYLQDGKLYNASGVEYGRKGYGY